MNDEGNLGKEGIIRSPTQRLTEVPVTQLGYSTSETHRSDTLLTQLEGKWTWRKPICLAMVHYFPAKLVRGKDRWYISWYQTDPVDGIRKRHRETFDLGRIPDLKERSRIARNIILDINSKLPYGYPYEYDEFLVQTTKKCAEAIQFALELKKVEVKESTFASYKSAAKRFLQFVEQNKITEAPVTVIDQVMAMRYSDYLVRTGLKAVSHNNEITDLKALFTELLTRRIIYENPWTHVKPKKVQAKHRKPIADCDIWPILNHLREHDKSVFLCAMLQYFCMIRPNEQRQLQRRDIHLERSIIYVREEISKTTAGHVTIPDDLMPYLYELGIDRLHPDDFILGAPEQIGSHFPKGKNTISARHKVIIDQLYADGKIKRRDGYELYSWKDTGGDAITSTMRDARRIQKQFRHSSLDITAKYLTNRPEADKKVKKKHRLPSQHDASSAS